MSNKSKTKKEKKKLSGKQIVKRILIGTTLIFVVTGSAAAGVYVARVKPIVDECRVIAYDKLSTVNKGVFNLIENTSVYSLDGTLITKIEVTDYKYTTIDKIPSLVQNGYIAVEDRRFLSHNGVDFKSLVGAGVTYFKSNVLNQDVQLRGGSTITQQVIKNTLLSQEQTIKRKIVEMFIAPELEKKYGKSDIMEFYLNTCYYGDGMYGVGSASKYYFGKEPKDLTVAEISLLIGMSNNPTLYSPVYNFDKSIEKQKVTLKTMFEGGVITQQEYEDALKEEVKLVCVREDKPYENYLTSYAIHSAVLKLMETDNFEFKYGILDETEYEKYMDEYASEYSRIDAEIRNGGYSIHTSFDLKRQEILQNALDSALSVSTEVDKISGKFTLQGGAVSINNETGLVDAIVGGRGTEDEFNRGFLAKRQPGSTMKPLVAYGVAFDTGKFYPSYKYNDVSIQNGPVNYDYVYRGKISLREALIRSNNTIPYSLMIDLQAQNGFEYLANMQFDTLRVDDNTAVLALGGMTDGVRVVDMAKAYSTLANGGIYSDATCLTKLESVNDGVVYDGTPNKKKVYEEDTAYMLLDILKGTFDSNLGLARTLKIKGITAAAKTGTTSDEKDSWFCGVTPYNTTAVWVGYDTPATIPNLVQNKYTGVIWNKYLTEISKDYKDKDFVRPVTLQEDYVDWDGNRVDYKTSTRDLFSTVAQSKVNTELEQQKMELAKQKEKELIALEKERVILAEDAVKLYEGMTCSSVNDLDIIDNQYSKAQSLVSSVADDVSRAKFENRLEVKKSALSTDYATWVSIRDDSANKEYDIITKEEEERKLAIANGYNKAVSVLVDDAKKSLEVLSRCKEDDETRYYYYRDAEIKIEKCSGTSEYKNLRSALERENKRLEIKIG